MSDVQRKSSVFRSILLALAALAVLAGVSYLIVGWQVRSSQRATLVRAQACLSENRSADVRSQLRWLLWFEPEQPDALLILAFSFFAEADYPQTISVLERIPKDSSAYGSASLTLARALLKEGRQTDAERTLIEHLTAIPESDQARQALLELYMAQFRQREAIALLEDRWTVFPGDSSIIRGLLLLETETVTADGRIIELESANQKAPHQPAVVLALANACAQLGRQTEAGNWFREALKLRPDHIDTCLQAADFDLSTGSISLAVTMLDRLEQTSAAQDDRYWSLRSRLHEERQEFEQALDDIQQAIRLRPGEVVYLTTQAGLQRRLGQNAAAQSTAQEAERIAQARSRLFIISNEFDLDHPTQMMCEEIAAQYDAMNRPDRGRLWRQLIPHLR